MPQRILRHAEFGLGPAEIGSILGKNANYVSAVIGSETGVDEMRGQTGVPEFPPTIV